MARIFRPRARRPGSAGWAIFQLARPAARCTSYARACYTSAVTVLRRQSCCGVRAARVHRESHRRRFKKGLVWVGHCLVVAWPLLGHGLVWVGHGLVMGFSWVGHGHGLAMGWSWVGHGLAMGWSWSAMGAPWVGGWPPWVGHGLVMGWSWVAHGSFPGWSWYGHGRTF